MGAFFSRVGMSAFPPILNVRFFPQGWNHRILGLELASLSLEFDSALFPPSVEISVFP